jgi:hypothetical protein
MKTTKNVSMTYTILVLMGLFSLSACKLYKKQTLPDDSAEVVKAREKKRNEKFFPKDLLNLPPDLLSRFSILNSNTCEFRRQVFESLSLPEYQRQTLTFHGEYQRTLRYDCSGNLFSDNYEAIVAPTREFTVYLKLRAGQTPVAVDLFNAHSCNHVALEYNKGTVRNHLRIEKQTELRVLGDMEDALLTFKMESSVNTLYVRVFYDCFPALNTKFTNGPTQEKYCEKSQDYDIQKYTYVVNFNPYEYPIHKTLKVYLSAESCKK